MLLSNAAASSSEAREKSDVYYVGGRASLSMRKGYFDFPAVEIRQDTARALSFLGGFSFGRRYEFIEWLRMQIGGAFDFGKAVLDTLADFQTSYVEKLSIVHAGIEAELQYVLPPPPQTRLTPFVRLGGGLNYVRFRERFYLLDNQRQEVKFIGMDANMEKRWCPNLLAGAGFDVEFSKDFGISVGYSFRYWRPVKYGYTIDLVEPVDYWEEFFTHMVNVNILFTFE